MLLTGFAFADCVVFPPPAILFPRVVALEVCGRSPRPTQECDIRTCCKTDTLSPWPPSPAGEGGNSPERGASPLSQGRDLPSWPKSSNLAAKLWGLFGQGFLREERETVLGQERRPTLKDATSQTGISLVRRLLGSADFMGEALLQPGAAGGAE